MRYVKTHNIVMNTTLAKMHIYVNDIFYIAQKKKKIYNKSGALGGKCAKKPYIKEKRKKIWNTNTKHL